RGYSEFLVVIRDSSSLSGIPRRYSEFLVVVKNFLCATELSRSFFWISPSYWTRFFDVFKLFFVVRCAVFVVLDFSRLYDALRRRFQISRRCSVRLLHYFGFLVVVRFCFGLITEIEDRVGTSRALLRSSRARRRGPAALSARGRPSSTRRRSAAARR